MPICSRAMSMSTFLKTRALSISDNILAAILFLGGAVVAGWLTDYLAQHYGLTPQVALVLSWSIGLLVFVALSLLLRPKKSQEAQTEPAQQLNQSGIANAPHNEFNPHNEFKPTLVVHVPTAQPLPSKRQQPRTTNPPALQARPARLDRIKIDAYSLEVANLYTTLHEGGRKLTDVWVAFAKFHRDADGSEDSWIDVRGYAEFFDTKGNSLFIADQIYWWQKEGDHKTSETFSVGDTEKLIVAIVGNKVYPYSGHYVTVNRHGIHDVTKFVLETRDNPLEGSEFLVRIVLIGTASGRQALKQSFDYHLSAHPTAAFRLKEATPEIAELVTQDKPAIASTERIIVDVTPEYLMQFFDNNTAIQGRKQIASYLGKWIKATGIVNNVVRESDDTQVYIMLPKGRIVYAHFREPEQIKRVEELGRDAAVTVLGRVSEVRAPNMELETCELIASGEVKPPLLS